MTTYDVAVLGGGPGGYATALRAAAHGLRVAIVEADRVGGTCLHRGCVPSKALLHVAHLADQVQVAASLGLATSTGRVDLAAVGRFRDSVVDRLARGLTTLLEARRIDVVHGWGRVAGAHSIAIDDANQIVRARDVVIATGSTTSVPPGVVLDGTRVLGSDDALRLTRVPSVGVVVGGGAVGVEFASLWRSLGSEVTLVEAAPEILPLEDPDSSRSVRRAFARRGITVRTSTSLVAVDGHDEVVRVALSDGSTVECDLVLIATGRRPLTESIGLDALGVLDARGYVDVDAHGRSGVEGLWAVGDVTPTLALAHAAFAEGFAVADAIAAVDPPPVDHSAIPRVTYCSPEVASVGLTEPQARAAFGGDVTVTTSTFAGNARALIEGEAGHVKLVCRRDGTVIGAHVVGPSATELIAELGLAVSWEALSSEIGDVVHAHPSLVENVRETALAAAGLPFHTHVDGR